MISQSPWQTNSYGDSEWNDLLTAYNGEAITYDTIGNPLTYRDGITMTWQNGRELATLTKGNKTVSYSYNADGIRTEKNSNGAVTEYFYDSNNNLTSLICGDTQLVFYYDVDGQADSFIVYSGDTVTRYYYVKNLQGDITKIMSATGTIVANYYYDAYGEIISITNAGGNEITDTSSVAFLNPLRYRGYVYDDDTGLYYLQSRYYDPTTKRFINADVFVNAVSNMLGTNMFSYCFNNPTIYVDKNGYLSNKIITGVIHLAITGKYGLYGWAWYYAAKAAIATVGITYLSYKGYKLSCLMFNHGMHGYGSTPSESIKRLLVSRLQTSSVVSKTISKLIKKATGNSIKRNETVEFTASDKVNEDLYYSLQHATLNISGSKRNGVWNLTVSVSDTYDFTEIRSFSKLSFGNAANDLGWAMQKVGMMVPYKISVSYKTSWASI